MPRVLYPVRKLFAVSIVFGALIWGSTGGAVSEVGPAASKGPLARATAALSGKSFSGFGDSNSAVETLHLCNDGRFVYDELSGSAKKRVARTMGSWRVLSASFGNGRTTARIRGVATHRALVLVIATDGRRTLVGGRSASVVRSELCR